MSASLKAHSTVLQHVRQGCPREDLRRLRVFAWSVTALLLTRHVSLTGWSLVISEQPFSLEAGLALV